MRDASNDSIQIPQHIRRRNPHCPDPMLCQPRIAPRVTLWPVAALMRLSIDLNAQFRRVAVKIEIVIARRMLVPELVALRSRAKGFPENDFRECHLTAQLLCA